MQVQTTHTDYETFTWKSDGKIFKGVGVYHLTFNVASDKLKLGTIRGRSKEEIAAVVKPLMDAGEACDASNPKYVEAVKPMAWVDLTEFGMAVDRDIANFGKNHDGVQVCRRVVMDSHIHLVVWVQRNTGKTILQMAHGFRTGITKIARAMGVWPVDVALMSVTEKSATMMSVSRSGNNNTPVRSEMPADNDNSENNQSLVRFGAVGGAGSVAIDKACDAVPYHVFEKPFIRTLYAQGQLQTMIDYVKLNPYRRWILVLHPELFKLHRRTRIAGLTFRSLGTHWSRAFLKWLKEDVVLLSSTRKSLDLLILQVESIRRNLLTATRELRVLSLTERYNRNYQLLMSIPGIGSLVAMCILTEIYDITRFHNEREFASYLGIIPTCHSSGEKVTHGEKTFRGNKEIGPMLIESCWSAINKDYGLGCAYTAYKHRMTGPEAIVRIARKMSNIIYSVLKTGNAYIPYQWNNI